MIPRKKRRLMIILSVVLVVLLIVAIFVTLYFTTDMFKSSKTLFSKYITQNFSQINKLADTSYMQEANTLLENNKYTSDLEAKIEYKETENTDNPINKVKLKVESQTDLQNNYDYKDITILNEDEKLFRVEYLENDNIHALRQDGIKQFVTNNANDEIIKIIENLKNINLKELLSFTEEEIQNIQNNYLGIISENVPENSFSKQSGVAITVGDTNVRTNAYTITLTKETFNNLYIKVLEQLKQDDIILSKLDNIGNEINKYTNEQIITKEELIEKIENTIEEIKNTNIGQEQRSITVYESNGELIRTEVKTEEYEINFDKQENSNSLMVEIKMTLNTEKENSIDVKLQKGFGINEENISITGKLVENGITNNVDISTYKKFENSTTDNTMEIKIYNEYYEGKLSINENIKLVNNFENQMELDSDNDIDFENLNEKDSSTINEKLKNNLKSQIEKINNIVSNDNINNILINLNIIDKPVDRIESTGQVTEAEKNRFNAKYELYESEDIDIESVKKLIDTVKDDLYTIKITSYKEKRNEKQEKVPNGYKLIIKKDNKNEKLANSLLEYLENNRDSNFTIKIKYNETNGLVENILINVNE